MKKFISFALAASMALSMIPATAFASSDLTTSHSNIRVTANTEFKPKKDAGSDYRDVPYILLEASNDFIDTKQTFELALENAEWLEMDGDDGDTLYVEDDATMKEYLQFAPASGDATSGSTSGSTPSGDVAKLQQDYLAAAQDLAKKAKAYQDYISAADNQSVADAQEALNSAQLSLADAQETLEEAKKANEALQKYTDAELEAAAKAYNDAVEAAGNDSIYQAYTTGGASATEPDDPTVATTSGDFKASGKYKGSITEHVFTSDYYAGENGDALTVSGVDESTDPTEEVIKAAVDAATDMITAGVEAASAHEDWENGQRVVKSHDDTIAAAKKKVDEMGIPVIGNTASATAMIQNRKDAAKAVEDAEKLVKEKEALVAQKQKELDEVSAGNTTKADFDAAIKARWNAGVALLNAGGISYEDTIIALDGKAGLVTSGNGVDNVVYKYSGIEAIEYGATAVAGVYTTTVNGTELKVTIDKKSDTRIIVTTDGYKFKDGDVLRIPLFVRTTGGVASVSIDSLNSEFTSEGKTFAKTADGDTNLTIEKTQSFYDGDEVKNIYIEELVPGTLEDDGLVSLRVNGDFKLKRGNNFSIKRITGNNLDVELTESVYTDPKCEDKFTKGDDSDEIYIQLGGTQSTQAVQYRITGLLIVEDGADFGDEATITVSGGGTSKQTVTIGTYEDYGVKMTAEDKELPVIYAGTKASSKYDNQTLKVVIEETVANSFIDNRKMELTLPEGVEFVMDNGDAEQKIGSIDDITEDFKAYNFQGTLNQVKDAFTVDADGGKITITSKDLPEGIFESSGSNKDRKRKFEFSVHVSAEADFTGDVVMTLSGPAVANQSVSATIATVKAPIEVRTTVNELKIDYRNTDVADITIVEPEAGLWAKDDVIKLEGERMSFEGGAKAEVVNGDMKLAKLGGDYVDTEDSGDDKNGVLYVKVDSRSSKTPAEIKISGLSLYMNRSLAAGDYKLKVYGEPDNEFFMNNYHKDGDDYANSFETAKVTVMNDFVKVVTAGRDKDDATFTTSIVVPVGSDVITAGTREIKLSEMEGGACPPAYINNDGYTMLPVRAVTESLNNIAAVRWDDATKTCTIGFGQRVFSMTVGSKVLNMNGVSTALNAAPEIRDGRVFLPLRDLGYALGLSESQISWDATTQTARLN
ncbi:stalk domain-containing protein [Clostridium sp. MD294]|uniref:stalk domain-containing protein n=1 Tax=Clostridium sp. MD294 TaxID=97138 RepID=UPI0002CB2F29|nr:stalk domain-containing protein [Clostridium sp. MD294]NDO47320.1 hypothetical protein [Clostridium sp. MD294]USF29611.1 hypothetical protein C820_001011 [Clostridium sp. MD294]